jgi:hypothetical protein
MKSSSSDTEMPIILRHMAEFELWHLECKIMPGQFHLTRHAVPSIGGTTHWDRIYANQPNINKAAI